MNTVRVTGAHKHAKAMAEYAEDALKTGEPWALWEYQESKLQGWATCVTHPGWKVGTEYRRKAIVWYQGVMDHPIAADLKPCLELSGWANNPDYWMRTPACVAVLKVTRVDGGHTVEVIPK